MGTRNLTCVYKDGTHKVAQYGQWDGYPEGQGIRVLETILNKEKLAKLEDQLKKCKFLGDNESEKTYRECESNNRDIGGDILDFIIDSNKYEILLVDSIDFAQDSLFCEFCYVIDFDKRTFEVYEGFNKKPLQNKKDRFFIPQMTTLLKEGKKEFFPVKMIKSYNLDNLPSIDEFLGEMNELLKEDK